MGRISSEPKKNYIINGDMRISQRGTSFATIANDTYFLDRYTYSKVGAAVHTASQDTDVPTLAQAGYLFQNSLRLNPTTPDTSIATGDRVDIQHRVEGFNWANLAQKAFTLSFWVKATTTGTYCVGFRNSGTDRSYVAEYTINASDTWEFKSVTVTASPSADSWNYTNGVGLYISFTLAAGTTLQTTAGAWQTGSYIATANQVNGVNTGASDFRITGVMLNGGVGASPFRPFGGGGYDAELTACMRYYEKSWVEATISAATQPLTTPYITSSSPTTFGGTTFFSVEKRTHATVTIWSPGKTQGQTDLFYNGSSGTTTGSLPVTNTTNKGFRLGAGGLLTSGNNGLSQHYWAADAEL